MSAPSTTSALERAAAEVVGPASVVSTQVAIALSDPARGRLADLAQWLASCQRVSMPRIGHRARLVVVDSTVAARDATIAAKADSLDVALRHTIAGSNVDVAIAAGIAMADGEADGGSDLLLLALPGRPRASTLAIVSALTGIEPARVLARGVAAIDPEEWMGRLIAIRDSRVRAMPHVANAHRLLNAVDEPVLGFATGLLLQSAARRTPVVLDGLGALTAGLIAASVAADAAGWWRRRRFDRPRG